MGSIAEKLSYLNGTKRLLRRRINSLGGNITLETKFRDYLLWLDRFYNAASSSVDFELLGETEQRAVNESTNLLPLYDGEIVTDGVTVTISNGKITVNGTAERDVYIKITNGIQAIYENPQSNDGHSYYNTYGWLTEKVKEFDPATTVYLQNCHGTGDAVVNEGISSIVDVSTNSSGTIVFHREGFSNLRNRENVYDDKDVVSYSKCDNTKEINCYYLQLKQGVTLNQYFWIQACLTQESTWTPNYDAAPASPDNPKYFWSPDDITYTASDGTEFPIWLTYPDAHYNFVLGAIGDYKDRIYYKNGKFYCERKIGSVTLDGTTNTVSYVKLSNAVDTGYKLLSDCLAPANNGIVANTLSNYFEAYSINDIINNKRVGLGIRDDKVMFLSFGENSSYTSASAINTWLSTHPTVVYYVLDEPVITEIENTTNNKTIYDQLKAIIDHETKLQIEEKIF